MYLWRVSARLIAIPSAFFVPTSTTSRLPRVILSFYRRWAEAGRIGSRMTATMTKNERQGPRKPATKFPNLQKKMAKQKVQVKKPTGKKK